LSPSRVLNTEIAGVIAMENSTNIMRIALIVSIIAHVMFMLFSGQDLRTTTHGQVVDVDLVPANEVPIVPGPKAHDELPSAKAEEPEPKPETPVAEPTAKPPAAAQSVARAENSKPPQSAPPTKEPTTPKESPKPKEPPTKSIEQRAPPADDQKPQKSPLNQIGAQPQTPGTQTITARDMAPDRLAAILGLPADQPVPAGLAVFGRAPERMSKLTEGVKELKTQVNKCLVLPPGVGRTERIKMIIHVELTREGALANDPSVIDAAAPTIGYPLMLSAIRALRQCAPYRLPADKYADWKMLEIDFSPDEMLD
jgi:outer membrane biosynthesis protein TonB